MRQLASSLLAVDPTFLEDDRQGQDYSELHKLQSAAEGCKDRRGRSLASIEQRSQHDKPEREEPRGASMVGRSSQDGGLCSQPNSGRPFGTSYSSHTRSCWPMRLVPVVKMSTFWAFTRRSADSMATSLTARTIGSLRAW